MPSRTEVTIDLDDLDINDVFDWINSNFTPSEVFTDKVLSENGYTKVQE